MLSLDTPQGIAVEVRNSFSDNETTGWGNGCLEGKRGVVLNVLRARDDPLSSTATVQLEEESVLRTIPILYLSPVPPDKVGQIAMVIAEASYGQVVKLRSLEDEDAGSWLVSIDAKAFPIVQAEHMARLYK